MSAYRKFHVLEDELGNKVELREEWINPEKDIWRWLVYAIGTNKDGHEELKRISNADGTLLYTALITAAGHFKRLRENWIEEQAKNKYTLDWSKFTSVEQQILAKFKALYEIAGISPRQQLRTSVTSADNYIIKQASQRCSCEAMNVRLTVLVYVYPSGLVNVRCNGQEFNLTILDPAILNAYYTCVLKYAKLTLPRGENIPQALNLRALQNLVKQRKLEAEKEGTK